ncbi:hypothetical protein CAPTEDRAFT_202474 [Capitella teleta]|uniref:Uncharacterized protein n=1 Tax=Capitella teleta TaxID=283909 RepID=R7UIN3_CAPTE|nr:hypothetical protein CAPTEDRAFT_202474 [Capitella teleta]|eukprot:ELU05958.1 hypothetical protein CAPTEDRAFT_202474 [Capitella teleta]
MHFWCGFLVTLSSAIFFAAAWTEPKQKGDWKRIMLTYLEDPNEEISLNNREETASTPSLIYLLIALALLTLHPLRRREDNNQEKCPSFHKAALSDLQFTVLPIFIRRLASSAWKKAPLFPRSFWAQGDNDCSK